MTIELKGIHKGFRDFKALDGVDLSVADGELLALLGPSGSGKTTLLRIIAGLDAPDSGEVIIDGVNTAGVPIRQRKVGFVFQHYALFRHMTVFENVAFGLRVRPREVRPSPADIRERVMALLSLVHLDQFASRFPHQLSGGQRQRVALARSLAVEPKLLLLDEPFGALDAKVRKELRRWLRRLHEEMHITTLFVTHDQEEALEVADRVLVMNRGRIEQHGTPEEVYHQPANGFVYDFLGNYNEFAGYRDENGEVRLVEDDALALTSSATKPAWFARYPEVRRLLRIPSPRPMSATPPADGTPVRIFARPHEMYLTREPQPGVQHIPATVIHVNPAGPLAKLELERENGTVIQVEVPKSIIDSLRIRKRDLLYVRPKTTRVFA